VTRVSIPELAAIHKYSIPQPPPTLSARAYT